MTEGELSTSLGLQWLRARKLATAIRDRPQRRALRLGVLPAIEHRPVLHGAPFQFIVDVGANRGQFLLAAAAMCPGSTLFCYEPLESPFAVLEKVAAAFPARVRCYQSAMADFDGDATMFVTRDDDNSSLLKPAPAQLERSPGSALSGTAHVAVARLDGRPELAFELPPHSLLKVDVQGYELGVLQGAEALLGSFSAVYAECSFVPLYEGQPLIDDIAAYLEAHGFHQSEQHNLILRRGERVQADMLFRRLDG